jgi:aminoglycoside 2'-N-acetyltransferase I
MSELVLAHTGQLPPDVLSATRDLLEQVFAGELTDEDEDHCLGGVHAVLRQDGQVIGHGPW